MYVIFASYGNDSVALVQYANEKRLRDVHVLFSDTGWAADWWLERVEKGEEWVRSLGFQAHRTTCEGMEGLVLRKKAWPRGGGGKFQFCTQALKKEPALLWLYKHDPNCEATCMTGVRREESENRRDAPEWIIESEDHGGRELWQPLVRHTEAQRNELVLKTPLPILPFRSKECYPCVNARRKEIATLDEPARYKIWKIEQAAGVNSKGNERVMFSPKKFGGAVGIDAVIEAAKHGVDDLFNSPMCESGWCGG